MCKRNLNANIIICNNVEFQGVNSLFSGVDNRITFSATKDNRLASKPFHAVVCLTAVFQQGSSLTSDDIKPDTTYDFALAYYDDKNSTNVSVCNFSHEFYADSQHTDKVSFSTYKLDVNIAEGHISFPYNDTDHVDLVLLVKPRDNSNAKWTRQTIERIYIQTP